MKDSDKIKITENDLPQNSNELSDHPKAQWEKVKKPVFYFLMAAICATCFYLIFKPKSNNTLVEEAGFNAVIPQAKDGQLQSDKQKAYEQQLLEQKNEEKRNTITTLSDYWNDQSTLNSNGNTSALISNKSTLQQSDQNAINSYRSAQQTLSSFYGRDDQEVNNLRKEISRLKNEAMQNNPIPAGLGMNDQLELMEKSYQMAAKYLPTTPREEESAPKEEPNKSTEKKVKLTSVRPAYSNIVSSLYREMSDSAFVAGLNQNRFYNAQNETVISVQSKNAIQGIIYETKTIVNESTLPIRLIEALQLGRTELPPGSLLIASGKFQGGRLQLTISSIQYKGSVYPVEINIYDNDGQLGLYVPYSPEQNAVSDVVANMSQASGTSIMMTQSAGQQVAADLSRGIVQGLSGYFQKRVRQLKVTVKAGHQVLLVPKNN
ncbi:MULTISPECIES: conjugative transposon protein TraM [Chryseobacterium]|uniref:Conjugative transposon TraM protein n=1 Tax=Chryseobacterium daecheongense TaxID=192389 RepID=A0A3N0VYN8_9FLAO|nr:MULTISPECIES: conjugative transposon protein TraM [Chryseobacterium]ROH97926.1 conjugative transposon protein TraM [Chryseobacterium daecheongense]TDX92896.1 conjugative transposon TraM protein [Chryseobacterium daecheongense]WFB67485.1 conjugative transposon protein TraM [Chryseobacterium sp. WX]